MNAGLRRRQSKLPTKGLGKSDFLRLDFAEDVALERAGRAEELLLGKIERESLVKAMTDQFDRADEICHLKHPAVSLTHVLLPDDRTGTTFGNPIEDVRDAFLPSVVKDAKRRVFVEQAVVFTEEGLQFSL